MKAVRIECYGNEEVMELAEVKQPKPGANHVLVKVQAAAVPGGLENPRWVGRDVSG